MNLRHKKCHWIQVGRDTCQDLRGWLAGACPALRNMQVSTVAKHLGTMLGPESCNRWWIEPVKKLWPLCAGKAASSCPSCVKLALLPHQVALQKLTAGPFNTLGMTMTMTHSEKVCTQCQPCPTDANGEVVTSAKKESVELMRSCTCGRLCNQYL